MLNFTKILTAFCLSFLLLLTACSSQPPSRFDQAQQESTQKGSSAVVKESKSGGSFNKYFPDEKNGYKIVYSQEKKGFAEAKLKKNGKEVAVMAISDTINNPDAVNKFKSSQQKISGYPAVEQGKTATAVLVSDRYQVKVLSRDPSFTAQDRQTWLANFDLSGLSNVK